LSNLQQTLFVHLSKKYTPFDKKCKLSVSGRNRRKEMVRDGRQGNSDLWNWKVGAKGRISGTMDTNMDTKEKGAESIRSQPLALFGSGG
jgi:hypothetical protein